MVLHSADYLSNLFWLSLFSGGILKIDETRPVSVCPRHRNLGRYILNRSISLQVAANLFENRIVVKYVTSRALVLVEPSIFRENSFGDLIMLPQWRATYFAECIISPRGQFSQTVVVSFSKTINDNGLKSCLLMNKFGQSRAIFAALSLFHRGKASI